MAIERKVTKELFATCNEHPNCTLHLGFAAEDDPAFDPISDRRPLPERLQERAEMHFGQVFCVATEHLDGALSVKVEE